MDYLDRAKSDLDCLLRFKKMMKDKNIKPEDMFSALKGAIEGKASIVFEEYKPQIDAWVDDTVVEVEELDSYYREFNPFGVPTEYATWESTWDEEEELQEKIKKCVGYLKEDKIYDYIPMDMDDDMLELMHKIAVKYLEGKINA